MIHHQAIDLLDCPHCGKSEPVRICRSSENEEWDSSNVDCFCVVCDASSILGKGPGGCGAAGGYFETRPQAIAAWNRRAPAPASEPAADRDALILLRAAAKDMYNKTFAETRLRLSSQDESVRDAAVAAGEVFVAALRATDFPAEGSRGDCEHCGSRRPLHLLTCAIAVKAMAEGKKKEAPEPLRQLLMDLSNNTYFCGLHLADNEKYAGYLAHAEKAEQALIELFEWYAGQLRKFLVAPSVDQAKRLVGGEVASAVGMIAWAAYCPKGFQFIHEDKRVVEDYVYTRRYTGEGPYSIMHMEVTPLRASTGSATSTDGGEA